MVCINTHMVSTITIYQGFRLLEMTHCLHRIHIYWQLPMGPTVADFIFNSVRYSLCPYHRWSEIGVKVDSSTPFRNNTTHPSPVERYMLPLWPYIEFHWCFLMQCWSMRCFHLRCPVSWDWSLHRKEVTLARISCPAFRHIKRYTHQSSRRCD
jgi:hypothetical protein